MLHQRVEQPHYHEYGRVVAGCAGFKFELLQRCQQDRNTVPLDEDVHNLILLRAQNLEVDQRVVTDWPRQSLIDGVLLVHPYLIDLILPLRLAHYLLQSPRLHPLIMFDA